jgi:hypothetical protein
MSTVTLTFDAYADAGINAARAVYNASIVVPPGDTLEAQPGYAPDEQTYVQFVMNMASESYCKQYNISPEAAAESGLRFNSPEELNAYKNAHALKNRRPR